MLTHGAPIELKWPNDLLFNGRKLAGLLCERAEKADFIGLGLNVNVDPRKAPASIRDRVTSLAEITREARSPTHFDMTEVLVRVAAALREVMMHHGGRSFADELKEYAAHHALTGRRVTITASPGSPSIKGTCGGLDAMGRLLVRTRNGIEPIIAGHVEMQ